MKLQNMSWPIESSYGDIDVNAVMFYIDVDPSNLKLSVGFGSTCIQT